MWCWIIPAAYNIICQISIEYIDVNSDYRYTLDIFNRTHPYHGSYKYLVYNLPAEFIEL